jgi:hypothetical protein
MDPIEWRGTWEEWFALAGACKAAGIARDDWVDWCLGDPEYADRRDEIERVWEAAWGEHPGALYAALAARNIRFPSQHNRHSSQHITSLSRVQLKSASKGKSANSGSGRVGHPLDRIKGLRAAVRRDQQEPVLFSYSCLYAEILFEQGTTSAKAFEVAQKLLEDDCRDLAKAIGIDAVRRCIRRAFAYVSAKLKETSSA